MSAGSSIPRLALTPDEAAASIGVGRSFFYEHILPDLRVIRIGRKRLIPVRELEDWTSREAARTLG
jgi:excisionase family DNA binding protein